MINQYLIYSRDLCQPEYVLKIALDKPNPCFTAPEAPQTFMSH